ncbi:MAG: PepSY-associated TM helix domain-containing protein [Sphingomonadales bacterium]
MVSRSFSALRLVKIIHKWLSLGAFVFWVNQAFTGALLSFHFELADALVSTQHAPTDRQKIEHLLTELDGAGGDAQVYWIWTSAGLADRYVVNFANEQGINRRLRINGQGDILKDRKASDHTVLSFMRAVHINLLSGATGSLVLAVTGVLLVSNLILGLIAAWPQRGTWKRTLLPALRGSGITYSTLYSWHRALGLWTAIPALLLVTTGVLMIYEHDISHILQAEDASLPANPQTQPAIGIAAAMEAAVQAIPGSRFVGTTLPSSKDASYYAWVRAPGELYRGGYGASLVIFDANNGSIRGAYPISEASAAQVFVKSLYPIHTGEAAGLGGRVVAMLTGIWLLATVAFGITLWIKRQQTIRKRQAQALAQSNVTRIRA